MAAITAGLVAQLRERTGLGMMECKKALTETDGDLEAAIELLRKKGTKDRGERVAGEGLVTQADLDAGMFGICRAHGSLRVHRACAASRPVVGRYRWRGFAWRGVLLLHLRGLHDRR